jgi:hypothetical protein
MPSTRMALMLGGISQHLANGVADCRAILSLAIK